MSVNDIFVLLNPSAFEYVPFYCTRDFLGKKHQYISREFPVFFFQRNPMLLTNCLCGGAFETVVCHGICKVVYETVSTQQFREC